MYSCYFFKIKRKLVLSYFCLCFTTLISSLINFLFCQRLPTVITRAAVGVPTSAIVSEIYMQSLETTVITTADHPPKVWERHVDDVFSIVHKIYLQELLEHINNLHPQTQFTKEEENNPTLPFLDTLVQRNHEIIMTILKVQ